MTEIPKNKISCKICKHRGESPISGACEGCNSFAKFEIDYENVCKWCYNPVVPGDNVCEEHQKSHTAHSWPGCIVPNGEITESKLVNFHEIAEKKARRERIASAIMAGIYANPAATANYLAEVAARAVCGADALIALLDEAKE